MTHRSLTSEAPDITVVIPVLNGARTVGACLSSLLALRNPPGSVEVIVVDNGSTDGTAEVLREFGDAIGVLHEARRGAAAARNRGILAARGRHIAFIDADAVAEPEWLVKLVEPLADPGVGISGGPILSVEPCNRIERFGEQIHNQQQAMEDDVAPYAASGNWASRREVLVEVGLFDPRLLRGQDVDLSWRIGKAGYRFVFAPGAVVRHRNERTIRGLMHEGFVHGRHGVALLARYGLPPARKRARLRRAVSRLRSDANLVDATLALLFDIGKVTGQAVAHWRAGAAPAGQGDSPHLLPGRLPDGARDS